MFDTDQQTPGFLTAAARLARTGLGAVQNRIELFAVELEEQRVRMIETLVWAAALVLLAALAVILFTATIIFLFPPDVRIYALAGFAVLYLVGAIVAAVGLRGVVGHESFPESLAQIKKDRAWLESLK
jgi:uncharacterized membrane protein YqjE